MRRFFTILVPYRKNELDQSQQELFHEGEPQASLPQQKFLI